MKNVPNPLQRYKSALAQARTYLGEISEAMDEMDGHATHGPINWADAGTAGRLRDELKEIADRFLGRGEYEKKG